MIIKLLVFLALVGTAAQAEAAPAHAVARAELEQTTRHVLAILQQKQGTPRERAEQAWEATASVLDYAEIAKLAIPGFEDLPAWGQSTAIQLLTRLFGKVMVATLVRYQGQEVVFEDTDQPVEGAVTTVKAEMHHRDGDKTPLLFTLKKSDRWRVADISVGGISLIANYRAQFQRLITQGGWERLKQKLEERVAP